MKWSGITNENEFYSQHYLGEKLSDDLSGVLDAWAERETQARDAAKAQGQREPDWRTPHAVLGSTARESLRPDGGSATAAAIARASLRRACTA